MSAFDKALLAQFPDEGEPELAFLFNYTFPCGVELNLAREVDETLPRDHLDVLQSIAEEIENLQYRAKVVRQNYERMTKPRVV